VVSYHLIEIIGKDEKGAPVHRLVHHEQTFPSEREAHRGIGRLRSSKEAGGIVLRKPPSAVHIDRPYVVEWSEPWDVQGEMKRESFKSPEHAERRAEYLSKQGYFAYLEEIAQPGSRAWREQELPVAGLSRVKHRLSEKLPFLVMYVTPKGPQSKSFDRETQAKAAAESLADRGVTASVYALTREGKKIPLGYYKPNNGVPASADPVAAQAVADAKAAPAAVAVVAPAVAKPNLRPAERRSPTGIPVVRGKRWGHAKPPKRYRRMGARNASDYGYPERFMYPLYFRGASGKLIVSKSRRHVANAKTRFTAHKDRYPAAIRATIASNINRAARRLGLPADVRP
jgi:hypothetical protein